MTLTQLLSLSCTILRRSVSAGRDEYGSEIPSVSEDQTVCELQQEARSEQGDKGELSDTAWVLFLPPGTEVNTGDAVIVEGRTYELIGDPWPVRNPRTREPHHIECTVRRTAGSEDGS